eukprot:991145_1
MASKQTIGNVPCEAIAAIKSKSSYCPKGGMSDLTIEISKRNRGRSCTKSKNRYKKRHRSASLSPTLRRRSSQEQEEESQARKRSKSAPPGKAQDGRNMPKEMREFGIK